MTGRNNQGIRLLYALRIRDTRQEGIKVMTPKLYSKFRVIKNSFSNITTKLLTT